MKDQDHWLVRPGTIRILWIAFIIILALTVIPDLFIHQHEYFGIESTFGFYAWYGFGACVVMIVAAKALGAAFLKRPETYYERHER